MKPIRTRILKARAYYTICYKVSFSMACSVKHTLCAAHIRQNAVAFSMWKVCGYLCARRLRLARVHVREDGFINRIIGYVNTLAHTHSHCVHISIYVFANPPRKCRACSGVCVFFFMDRQISESATRGTARVRRVTHEKYAMSSAHVILFAIYQSGAKLVFAHIVSSKFLFQVLEL